MRGSPPVMAHAGYYGFYLQYQLITGICVYEYYDISSQKFLRHDATITRCIIITLTAKNIPQIRDSQHYALCDSLRRAKK